MQVTPVESINSIEIDLLTNSLTDYARILETFQLNYKPIESYLQVGEINKTQGWLLHISVIISQITDLLHQVIPYLVEARASFKIIKNESTAQDILNGEFGAAHIGKIISIYPQNDETAVALAKTLVNLTKGFKGPAVPTDLRLGNTVYTRYGSFSPILKTNEHGVQEKYIYDSKGNLVVDSYAIPFQFPTGVNWPFTEITRPVLPDPPKLINRIYRILDFLKIDHRGNVYKGLYLKNLFQVKRCVLKQGFINSGSDKFGRDVQDRLIWQYQLYKELSDTISMPVIYELLQEEGFTLLIMEYINGVSLYQKAKDINPLSKSWPDLPNSVSTKIINYAIEITRIIDRMHKKKYLHRDIMPANFLVGPNDKIFSIDIELGYSLLNNKPEPPFLLGTPGFMSPEQATQQKPATSQDIYSLGATLLYLFTGITPIKFAIKDPQTLTTNLDFFIENKVIASLIANCLHPQPNRRPDLSIILKYLLTLNSQQTNHSKSNPAANVCPNPSSDKIKQILTAAIEGLTRQPVAFQDGFWFSRKTTTENLSAPKNKEFTKLIGLSEGICGPLYVLARLCRAEIDSVSIQEIFKKPWNYVEQKTRNAILELSPGLHKGTAGIALVIVEAIQSGMLENSEKYLELVKNCLELKNDRLDLANGIAGQGLALLRCRDYIKKDVYQYLLEKIVATLLQRQMGDGRWIGPISNGKKLAFDFGHDDAGVNWFLLEYLSVYPSPEINKIVSKGLETMLKEKKLMSCFFDTISSRDAYEVGDGGKGMILLFIKAYNTLHDPKYKMVAEKALLQLPPRIVNTNFNQQSGLAGLGEVYLEASSIFNDQKWKDRADWIANLFLHTFSHEKDGSGYWIMEENNPPTGDLLIGMSGIIHFLARCLDPHKIGYRILS
jgi:serine/threonine protein kinase